MPRLAKRASIPGSQFGRKSAKSAPSRDRDEQQLPFELRPQTFDNAHISNRSRPTPQRRAQRGFDSNNLPTPLTYPSIESLLDGTAGDHASPIRPRRETRASRNGLQPNYSAKFHPMDRIMFPKRARRILGHQLASTPRTRRDDHTTSDESEGELILDDETEDSENDADSGLAPFVHLQRSSHPKATRSSARSHKHINYSNKYHPQDYGIDGFKHLARRGLAKDPKERPAAVARKPAKGKAITMFSSDEISGSDDRDDELDHNASSGALQQSGVQSNNDPARAEGYVSIPKSQDSAKVLSQDEASSEVDAILRGSKLRGAHAKLHTNYDEAPSPEEETVADDCTGLGTRSAADDASKQYPSTQPASLLLTHLKNASSKPSSSNTLRNVSSSTLRYASDNTQMSEEALQSSHFENEMAVTETRTRHTTDDDGIEVSGHH